MVLAIIEFPTALLATTVMAVACATLSVFVVTRRWAFIGEGISHSGFGGAGTAWLLGLAFPALDSPDRGWVPYAGVICFCLLTALAIAYFTREGRAGADTVIGIFMVASLAWGFIAQSVYLARRGINPAGWETFLFGDMRALSPTFALIATAACAGVVVVVAVLGKEILAYCFDPAMAQASGVPAGFIHYLLILLVTLTIIIGARLVGTVLVTALLVLPGATALTLSTRLRPTFIGSVAAGVAGALAGLGVNARWPFLPTGPAIVLALFALFFAAYVVTGIRRA